MNKERLMQIRAVIRSWLVWNDWNKAQREVLTDILIYIEQTLIERTLENEQNE